MNSSLYRVVGLLARRTESTVNSIECNFFLAVHELHSPLCIPESAEFIIVERIGCRLSQVEALKRRMEEGRT